LHLHILIVFEERYHLDIQRLRQETKADHENVEGTVPLMHQGLSAAEYVQCLQRFFGIVNAWEQRAAEVAPEWLKPTLLSRQRAPLLKQDLAWFGVIETDGPRPTLPEMNDIPSLLGTMYVMEGSTLGGQFIARHVEAELFLTEGQGNSYFRGHGNQTGPLWKEFCDVLKERVPDEQTDAVVLSAKAMFQTFGTWMQGNSAINAS
jgi:heme oxygenase